MAKNKGHASAAASLAKRFPQSLGQTASGRGDDFGDAPHGRDSKGKAKPKTKKVAGWSPVLPDGRPNPIGPDGKPVAKHPQDPHNTTETITAKPGEMVVHPDRPQPFLTPDEQAASNKEHDRTAGGLVDLDAQIAQAITDADAQTGDATPNNPNDGTIERQRVRQASATVEQMAARGLSRSSIAAGDLTDIEVAATERRNYVRTALTAAKGVIDRKKKMLADEWTDWQDQDLKRKQANADAAAALMPEWITAKDPSQASKPDTPTHADAPNGTGGIQAPNNIASGANTAIQGSMPTTPKPPKPAAPPKPTTKPTSSTGGTKAPSAIASKPKPYGAFKGPGTRKPKS